MSGATGKMNAQITTCSNGYLGELIAVEIDHADGTGETSEFGRQAESARVAPSG